MTTPTPAQIAEGRGWQPIETAPAATGGDDERILVVGGYLAKPELVLPDGDWWRMRKREGGVVPERWMRVPPVGEDADTPAHLGLCERVRALEEGLSAAVGYMTNAKIDLQTGCPKTTAVRTIEGGITRARALLSPTQEQS